jgi:hypothetical protein
MGSVMFSKRDIQYPRLQHIARIATAAVSPDGSGSQMLLSMWVSISTANILALVDGYYPFYHEFLELYCKCYIDSVLFLFLEVEGGKDADLPFTTNA